MPAFVDSAGMSWIPDSCGAVFVDTNGAKNPNKWGRDRFPLMFATKMNLSDGSANTVGIPKIIFPKADISTDPDVCPSGNCNILHGL